MMKTKTLKIAVFAFVISGLLIGCSAETTTQAPVEKPTQVETTSTPTPVAEEITETPTPEPEPENTDLNTKFGINDIHILGKTPSEIFAADGDHATLLKTFNEAAGVDVTLEAPESGNRVSKNEKLENPDPEKYVDILYEVTSDKESNGNDSMAFEIRELIDGEPASPYVEIHSSKMDYGDGLFVILTFFDQDFDGQLIESKELSKDMTYEDVLKMLDAEQIREIGKELGYEDSWGVQDAIIEGETYKAVSFDFKTSDGISVSYKDENGTEIRYDYRFDDDNTLYMVQIDYNTVK